jgi:hypothetical protein
MQEEKKVRWSNHLGLELAQTTQISPEGSSRPTPARDQSSRSPSRPIAYPGTDVSRKFLKSAEASRRWKKRYLANLRTLGLENTPERRAFHRPLWKLHDGRAKHVRRWLDSSHSEIPEATREELSSQAKLDSPPGQLLLDRLRKAHRSPALFSGTYAEDILSPLAPARRNARPN